MNIQEMIDLATWGMTADTKRVYRKYIRDWSKFAIANNVNTLHPTLDMVKLFLSQYENIQVRKNVKAVITKLFTELARHTHDEKLLSLVEQIKGYSLTKTL